MKRHNKCALGLVAAALSVVALAGCSKVNASNVGAVVTYTDASGNRVSYTAEELFGTYLDQSSSLSTEFDKIYEVLVRKYYDEIGGSKLESLKQKATQSVTTDRQTAKTNASNNGTTVEEEWETILDSHNVDNVDELYQYYLYQAEQDDFNSEIDLTFGTGDSSVNGYEAMRDGEYTLNGTTYEAFPSDVHEDGTGWGIGNDGYLKDQMPYHIRHILVKNAAGAEKEYTQDHLSTNEATKVANVILGLAGATLTSTSGSTTRVLQTETNRSSFGQLAVTYSEDTSSATAFGEGSVMTKESGLINEYKLGIYAYESLYNQREKATTYGAANVNRITPGLTQESTVGDVSAANVDESLFVSDKRFGDITNNYNVTVNHFFQEEGIGEIPFGAALALADYAAVTTDDNGGVVNESNETFMPRNVLWNKYFNKHQICVITPNAIESNTPKNYNTYKIGSWANNDTVAAAAEANNAYIDAQNINENYEGVYSSQFGSLPGFSVDTTNILPQYEHNVLTNSEGQVVLAVRGGSDTSYQGIFFIVVERSALSEYGLEESGNQIVAASSSAKGTNGIYTVDRADLSDYYNVYTPDESDYPEVAVDGGNYTDLSTIINFNRHTTSEWNTQRDTVVNAISDYNTNINSYNFQRLYEQDNLEFKDETIKERLMNYSQTTRQSSQDSDFESWSDSWKEYAESIASQEAERNQWVITQNADGTKTLTNNTNRTGELITERAVIEYLDSASQKSDIWASGGACYYATR